MTVQTQQSGKVELNIHDEIAEVTFGHPKSNALPGNILKQVAGTIMELGNNNDVKVIILKSEGDRTFCAGASFDELLSINDFETGKKFFMGFANLINACRTCPKLIIGRVQGKAVGGGVGIASACDYALATKFASVKLSELAVGIGPFVVGPAVERKIGTAAFSDLSINATAWKDAEWACRKGLYAEVFSSTEELDEAIASLAEKLARSNPEAMTLMKKTFWQNTEHWNRLLEERAEMSGKLVLSEFTRGAINQFKEGSR